MDKNLTNIKERALKVAKINDISIEKFLKSIDMTYGSFKGKAKLGSLNSDAIEKILTLYPETDANWLITGKELVNNYTNNSDVKEGAVQYFKTPPKGAIPYYNLPVSAGHSPFEIEGAIKPDGYIVDLPGIGSTEAFLPVHGYSMQPEIKEGSIIGVRTADSWDHLNTQHKYLIISSDDRMIKYIEHDEDNNGILWCISPNYKRFSILKEDIIKVYRVTFVMNPE